MRPRAAGTFLAAIAAGAMLPAAAPGSSGVERALSRADAPAAQLERSSGVTLPGGTVVRHFAQEVGGTPVQGTDAVVIDSLSEAPRLLFDETELGLASPGDPRLSRDRAIALAADAVGLRRADGPPSARLVIVPRGDGILTWEVSMPARAPLGDFLVMVDASSGAILSERDLLVRVQQGQARLFNPNPVVEQGGYDGLKDRRDEDTQLLTSLRDPVILRNIEDGQSCLRGSWASVTESPERKPVCKDTLNWEGVKRQSNKFEALMTYHHIDRGQEYIQGLGFLDVNAERQSAVANGIRPDQSFYSSMRDRITLGSGGVDDAEDAEIIIHEYGHAVHDAQNPGYLEGGPQAGAQGEGFGDYLAAVYAVEEGGVDPASEFSRCVGEWDAISYDDNTYPGVCLRRVDSGHTWQQHKNFCQNSWQGRNEIHCIGEVWSAALWDLRAALGDSAGDSVMDRVVLASHFLTDTGGPDFQNAGEMLIQADEDLYGGAHCVAISAELEDRGLSDLGPC